MSYAAGNGSTAAVREVLAIDGVELNTIDYQHRGAYWHAACGGYLGVLKALLANSCVGIDYADEDWRAPLFMAAKGRHLDCVRWLLATGYIDATRVNKRGTTALMACLSLGDVSAETGRKVLEMAKLIVAAAPETVDMVDNIGMAPLHLVASNFSTASGVALAALLLGANVPADVNRESLSGTALEICLRPPGNSGVAKAIIATGNFDFSVIGGANRLLEGGLWAGGKALVLEMIQHGFRPLLGELLYRGGGALAEQLLVAMDSTLTIEYLKHQECLDIFDLLHTPRGEDRDRKDTLAARHPRLLQVIRTAAGPWNESEAGEFPTLPNIFRDFWRIRGQPIGQ